MSDRIIPKATASETGAPALFGFAIKAEPARRARPPAKRRPPLRRCGRRHWPKVCPDCLEQEAPAASSSSAQLSELPGETFEDIFRGAA